MVSHNTPSFTTASCPVPLPHNAQIVMGHGSGGRMTRDLINQVFKPLFSNSFLDAGNDFASLPVPNGELVISTDNHVVSPLFFPGGDIGRLAVCGTVNDIAVSGANPLYLTAGFILEEGLSIETLGCIVESMREACEESGVKIISGDTKVVEKGRCDGLYINTTGIGWKPVDLCIHGAKAHPSDSVLITGTVADHGMAVLSARGELALESEIQSDVSPLNGLVVDLLKAAPGVHVLRDPTRGGLATTLNEIALQSNCEIILDEKTIPITRPVKTCCEMLGFDPLYVANEGKLVIILPSEQVQSALDALWKHPFGRNSALIGSISEKVNPRVLLKTLIGGTRILDMLSGEMLPRIC